MELAGSGTTTVSGNHVQGFAIGVGVASPTETVKVIGNAIYDADIGVTKFNNGYTTQALIIDGNQIENPRTAGISSPEWKYAHAPVLSNNLIIRKPGYWSSDATRTFAGVNVSPVDTGTTAMSITGNRIYFDGATVTGFTANGISLGGSNGNLTGLTISDNWIGTDGKSTYGNGIWLNSWGASTGVTLSNNRFQNLAALTAGVPEANYLASGNGAINMSGSAVNPASLAVNQNVSVSAVPVLPMSVTGAGPLTVKLSATGTNGFVPWAWLAGNGARTLADPATGPSSSVFVTYQPAAKRIVRLLSTHPSGAMTVGKSTITVN